MLAAGRGKAAEINETAVVLVDLDEGDIEAKLAHLARYLGEPTLEIASGGVTSEGQRKRHLYWGLSKPASGDDLRRVVNIRRLLAEKVGGDPAFGSPAQLIRVAGSIHAKSGEPRPVEVIARRPRRFDLGSFEAAALDMPAMNGLPDRSKKTTPAIRDLMTRAVRENGADGVTRHEAMTSVIGHWLRQERLGLIPSDEAWRAVSDHNAALIRPRWPEERLRREFERLRALDSRNHGVPAEIRVASLTEDGLARAFAAAHADRLRHVDGQWYQWTSSHWQPAGSGLVVELVRVFCKTVADDRGMGDDRRLHSLRVFKAVEELARCDQRLRLAADSFDCDPMLLNTPDGIIDLRTGEVRPGDPGANLSRTTLARPGRGPSPLWSRFIAEVTQGDAAFAAYLARVAGYCLTGRMGEQAFFFLHGKGGSGKSTFVKVMAAVLGSYATTAAFDTFLATKSDRHPTELARLHGARLVTGVEIDRGRSWNESVVKALTGGDRVAARRMHADFSEFAPACKLMFAGNHMPPGRFDGAMRRRLQRIPFDAQFTGARRIIDLDQRLLEEADDILSWMIEGCVDWQQTGLAPPPVVLEASRSYFEEEDPVGQWLEECCVKAEGVRARSRDLHRSYRTWAHEAGIEPLSMPSLIVDLKARGFREFRNAAERGLQGLSVPEHASGELVA